MDHGIEKYSGSSYVKVHVPGFGVNVPENCSSIHSSTPPVCKSFQPRSRLTRSLVDGVRAALTTSTARPPGSTYCPDHDFQSDDRENKSFDNVQAHRNRHAFIDDGRSDSLEFHAEVGGDAYAESESDHNESWHDHYYELADNYKSLVQQVATMASEELQSRRSQHQHQQDRSLEPPPNARGKLYHFYGHESSTGLNIKSRCEEAGCEYMELPITGDDADLDHLRYERFKQQLITDLREDQVLGFITDPPCETFI